MDDKKFALFSRALLSLYEGYCEEHGAKLINPRVTLADFAPIENERSKEEGKTA